MVSLAVTGLFMTGCGQEQNSAPAPPKAETKPLAAPASPAAPVVPTTPAPVAQPAPPPAKPASKMPTVPNTMTLAASQGQVTLSHLSHAKLFPCATCHGEATPGKLDLDKDTAHALCRDCHQAKGTGPTACGDCHKK
jgi:hypothetical protein